MTGPGVGRSHRTSKSLFLEQASLPQTPALADLRPEMASQAKSGLPTRPPKPHFQEPVEGPGFGAPDPLPGVITGYRLLGGLRVCSLGPWRRGRAD